jgi:FAD:protein FMN transferase
MRHPGIEAKRTGRFALIAFLMLFLGGCGGLRRFEFTRLEMGVRTRVVTYAPSKDEAERGAAAAFGRIAELDAIMSDYRADSELMRLCAHTPGEAVPISDDLFNILLMARRISVASGGAFDVTVGPLVALWRETRKTGFLPSKDAIEAAKACVGYEAVVIDRAHRTATLTKPGMKLDLGGIAKGYAAQQAVRVLQSMGQERCLVALAGDVFAGEAPPRERGWRVAVASPWGRESRTLLLRNQAVSTSGDREQFVVILGTEGGGRYSHVVDPRTGLGATTQVQATVVSHTGAFADALSTAVSVLGAGPGGEMIIEEGAAAIVHERGRSVVIDGRNQLHWADGSGSGSAGAERR